ncbi:MAG: Fe-S cluster assembly protein SufD [Bacteroidota bacterium]|nr:Fe-S cluster assembly protein SufD [Bacteroidota bacterium]
MKKTQALQTVQTRFEEFEHGLNGAAASPLHARRKEALARFLEAGFPTMRDEEWRYTNINAVLDSEFARAPRPTTEAVGSIDVNAFLPGIDVAHRLVFIDGHFIEELSSQDTQMEGLTVRPLSAMIRKDASLLTERFLDIDDSDEYPFASLNMAFAEEGAFLHAKAGAVIEQPVHLLFLSTTGTAYAAYPRLQITVERGAQLSVIEQHAGGSGSPYFRSVVSECVVEEDARLLQYKLQEEGPAAQHFAAGYARVARGGDYQNHYFGFGAALLRNNLHTVLADEHAECTVNGVYIPMDAQHMDHHTVIDHAMPNGNSHELYKGILLDASRAVFSGRIIVRVDAQKTDARQSNNNLLLSNDAQIDTKPQLEIWADDVKCTHGATIGRIDENALFYLRSRGIPEQRAKNILSYAFASELLSHVQLPALREHLDQAIHTRLERTWNKA